MFRFIAENKAKGVNLGKPTRKSNKKLYAQTEKILEYRNVNTFVKKKRGGQKRIKGFYHKTMLTLYTR